MKNIKKIIFKLLNDPNPFERRRAAEELSEADERAIYALIKALRDESTAVQEAATNSLISIGTKEDSLINLGELVTYMVIPLLREEEAYLRNTALLIIREIGHRAPHLIASLLKDKDPDVRKFSLDIISEIKAGFDSTMIIPLLKDPNANVRAAAAKTLGELGAREAIPALIECLNDEEWVIFYVLQALTNLKANEAIEKIGDLLLNTDSQLIKYEAIETLGKIDTEAVIEPLMKYFTIATMDERREIIKALIRVGIIPFGYDIKNEILTILKDEEWDNKLIALRGVVLTNLREAVPIIVEEAGSLDPACFDYEDKVSYLEEALLSIDSEDELIKLLEGNKIKFRAKAFTIRTLGKLRSKKAVPILIKLLEDMRRDVRIASAWALGEIGDYEAVSSLIKRSFDDPDTNVRKTAIQALGMIRDPKAFDILVNLLEREIYPDIIEALVKALISIDQERFFGNLKSYKREVKQTLAHITDSFDILNMLFECEDKEVRKTAIQGFGKLGTPDAISKLIECLRDVDEDIRKTAIVALGEAQFCSEELFKCLEDKDPWIRYYAIKSIYKACDPEILKEKLIPLLEDPFPPVVIAALDVLSEIATKEIYNIILSKKNHPDKTVREKIEEFLNRV